MLLMPTLADALPADHLVWDVLSAVDKFDLWKFEVVYRSDGVGPPPFAPKAMVGLILYSGSKRMRSDREIAQATVDDLGARLIMGNHKVSRSTIVTFRRLHAQALRGLLGQSVRIGRGMGLVDVSVVAGNGTKMSANSAMATTVDPDVLTGQIATLEKRLQDALRVWAEVTGEQGCPSPQLPAVEEWPSIEKWVGVDDEEVIAGRVEAKSDARTAPVTQQQAWRRVCVIRAMLNMRLKALEHLRTHSSGQDAEWQAKVTAARTRVARSEVRVAAVLERLHAVYDARQAQITKDRAAYAPIVGYGPPMVEPSRHSQVRRAQDALDVSRAHLAEIETNPPCMNRVNTTDPASRIMPGKHGGFLQAYNVQIMTSADQFILTIGIHDNPNDKQALVALVNDAQTTLHAAGIIESIGAALFDNGYASKSNFKIALPEGTLLLIAVQKEARQTGRKSEQAEIGPTWQDMADRLKDPANVALYKRRSAIVEPVFAQIFNRTGNNLYHRDDVLTELHLLAVTHNFLKIRRHSQRKRAAA